MDAPDALMLAPPPGTASSTTVPAVARGFDPDAAAAAIAAAAAAALAAGEPLKPALLASLAAMTEASAVDRPRCRFLRDFSHRIEADLVDFNTLDELHYALYEEWTLCVRAAPWIAPHLVVRRPAAHRPAPRRTQKKKRREGPACCHFLKSNENRPVLEAECRSSGLAFTPKHTRLMLAALLLPGAPDFCGRHADRRPANRKKRPAAPARPPAPVAIHMRGSIDTAAPGGGVAIAGVWSASDDDATWAALEPCRGAWAFSYRSAASAAGSQPLPFRGGFAVDGALVEETRLAISLTRVEGASQRWNQSWGKTAGLGYLPTPLSRPNQTRFS